MYVVGHSSGDDVLRLVLAEIASGEETGQHLAHHKLRATIRSVALALLLALSPARFRRIHSTIIVITVVVEDPAHSSVRLHSS